MSESTDQNVQLRVVWGDVSQLQVLTANQFALQVSAVEDVPDEVILTVGHVSAPVLTGSPEEQQAAVSDRKSIEIRPIARYSISVRRFNELANAIGEIQARLVADGVV